MRQTFKIANPIHATTMELATMKSMPLDAIVKQDTKETIVNNDPAKQICANMAALVVTWKIQKMVIVAIVPKVSVATIAKLRTTVSHIFNVY